MVYKKGFSVYRLVVCAARLRGMLSEFKEISKSIIRGSHLGPRTIGISWQCFICLGEVLPATVMKSAISTHPPFVRFNRRNQPYSCDGSYILGLVGTKLDMCLRKMGM